MAFWTFLYIKVLIIAAIWFFVYSMAGALYSLDPGYHFKFAILPFGILALIGILYFLFFVW